MSSNTGHGFVHELPTDLVVGRDARIACQIIVRRRARQALLPQGMLVDVAWDVLLHLLGHRAEPEQTTTEAIAAANGLSPTVALRWLSLLQADGQVQFRPERTPAGWELSVPFLARMIGYLRDHYPELL